MMGAAPPPTLATTKKDGFNNSLKDFLFIQTCRTNANSRVPDGGWIELCSVHESHIEGGGDQEFSAEDEDGEEGRAGGDEGGGDATDAGDELGHKEQRLPAPLVDDEREEDVGRDLDERDEDVAEVDVLSHVDLVGGHGESVVEHCDDRPADKHGQGDLHLRASEHVLHPVPWQLLGLLGAHLLLLLLLLVGKEDVRTEFDLVDLGSLLYQCLGSLRLAVRYEPPESQSQVNMGLRNIWPRLTWGTPAGRTRPRR